MPEAHSKYSPTERRRTSGDPNKATDLFNMISVVIVVFTLAGIPSRSFGQETDLYQQVLEQFEFGNFDGADSLIHSSTKPDSLSIELTLLRARIRIEQEKFNAAAVDFRKILSIEPGHPEAVFGLRRLGADVSPLVEMRVIRLKDLVDEYPDDLTLRLQYADELVLERDYSEAIKHYRIYLEGTQASPQVLTDILVVIAKSGQSYAMGEKIAMEYTATYPSSDDLQMRLGYFRLWRRRFTGAHAAFDRALEINPSNQDAKEGITAIAEAIQAENSLQVRNTELVASVEKSPDDYEVRFRLIDHQIRNGQLFDASQHLAFLEGQFKNQEKIQSRVSAARKKLRSFNAAHSSSRIDRIYLQLIQDPTSSDRRFSLVESLLSRERYFEAYDQLTLVQDSLQASERWKALFTQADNGLIQTIGFSPLYPVDRLLHLVQINPGDLAMRYALIDSLVVYNRFVEAMDVLFQVPEPDSIDKLKDEGYQGKLSSIVTKQFEFAEIRIVELRQFLEEAPAKELFELRRELIDQYMIVGNPSLARDEFEQLLSSNQSDVTLELEWIEFLRTTDDAKLAAREAKRLLDRFGGSEDVQKAFVLTHFEPLLDDATEKLLAQLVGDSTLTDSGFLLEVANYYVDIHQVESAQELLDRVEKLGIGSRSSRFESVSQLLTRERFRKRDAELLAKLNHARRLVASGEFDEAIREYESYFEARGIRLRSEVEELAAVHLADSNRVSALEMMKELQEEVFSYGLAKEMARIKVQKGDYPGALNVLERLAAINPRDLESSLNHADVLKELDMLDEAQTVVDRAASAARGSKILGQQAANIEADIRRKQSERGEWASYDLVGIIVPTAYSIHASGGGTEYDRRTEGLRAEVTLPTGAVVTAGFNTHSISGSRRLVSGSEHVKNRVNQIFGSVFLDLTPPVRSEKASYTNRIFVEAGIYDYEGTRSVGYFNARYWRQDRGKFLGSIGLRTNEGSIDLWTAGGGEFDLRLMRLDVTGSYVAALPDSVLRLGGSLAMNIVSDNLALPGGSNDRNIGSDVMLEAAYKVIDHTYLGIAHHQLSYQSRTDMYFSPDHYEVTELFLEFEKERYTKWYLRLRGSIGAVSRSSGSISQRLELDLIRRLTDHISITVSSTLGEASRAWGGGSSALFNKYNTFHLTGTLRWTL
ncbi:MAG: tetratricopeptide repeat protein [Bacteroidetes bacterium]|nr:MAG: tetratricopeptide repeat protein [Bacteroidota bacterium]